MKKSLFVLMSTCVGLMGLSQASWAGDDAPTDIISGLVSCNNSYFKAIKAESRIPSSLKVEDGDMAYLKIDKQPLDEVRFEKPFVVNGLTVTGYIFNDEIVRYVGLPDMHTHFWGLLVKNDWRKVVDTLKLNWEAVDSAHMSAHADRVARSNMESTWRPYQRTGDYKFPPLGLNERAVHVQPYKGQTMIFCALQTAGGPSEKILKETRPDLLKLGNKPSIREEKTMGITPEQAHMQ